MVINMIRLSHVELVEDPDKPGVFSDVTVPEHLHSSRRLLEKDPYVKLDVLLKTLSGSFPAGLYRIELAYDSVYNPSIPGKLVSIDPEGNITAGGEVLEFLNGRPHFGGVRLSDFVKP